MENLYLAVDPMGVELASNMKMFRVHEKMIYLSSEEYRKQHPIEHYYSDTWMDTVIETDYGFYGYDFTFEGITLPNGTIEKLTGKKLTFQDEPIKFTFQYESKKT